ncbi:ABC transporter ATP-binding protein [Primorskyibacter sp. S187A]|uniref:ABC transporter ATP-binding protein n=1 Tax=Primorskyibacter sp. S187A TaxID=3415130 RepID=UPI003C7EA18E
MSHAFLCSHDLSYHTRAGVELLSGAEFELDPGATLAIAGPNGAGKTTLMRILAGTVAPSAGHVSLDGQDLASLSLEARARQIALVSQHENPDGRLRLRDYVALGQMPIWADYSSAAHAEALDRVLDLAQLRDRADSPMARLSGGERQRAHIARALAQRPKLLLLDEPTNHLDPDAKGRMLSLVSALGITIVMILHDLVLIPEFASHVALMQDGRIMHFGPASEVLTPEAVQQTFGVSYLLLPYEERVIPALDIRKTSVSI